jgi:hypothetical protein
MRVNDVEYVRKDSVTGHPGGKRAVVVVDRGWIFAGDIEDKGDFIVLHDAVHVFRWESIGFDGMLAAPGSNKVTLKRMPHPVEIPVGAVIFRVPVPSGWGDNA